MTTDDINNAQGDGVTHNNPGTSGFVAAPPAPAPGPSTAEHTATDEGMPEAPAKAQTRTALHTSAIEKLTPFNTLDSMVSMAAISDLFFNYEHPAYDGAHKDGASPSDEDLYAAAYVDAQDFAGTFENATGISLSPGLLAADFIGRI
jgi:hypothetical protein